MHASTDTIGGSCLCGQVRIAVRAPLLTMVHCHCADCRHQHGNMFATYTKAAADAVVVLDGSASVRRYRSSATAVREFCACCGSKLFYRADNEPAYVWLAAGVFDDDPVIRSSSHRFVAGKAPWHEIGDALPQYAGRVGEAGV